MNANRLLSITIENQASLDDILKMCEERAMQGFFEVLLMRYVSTELISELGQLGFRVQKNVNHFCETVYIVSWA